LFFKNVNLRELFQTELIGIALFIFIYDFLLKLAGANRAFVLLTFEFFATIISGVLTFFLQGQ